MVVSATIVTIFDAPLMTKSGRRAVAGWLRKQAKLLEAHPKELARRYTANYVYEKRSG